MYDFQNDLDCIAYDIEQTIQKTDLTEKQRAVIILWRRNIPISGDHGKSEDSISEILKISPRDASKTLNQALERIIKTEKEIYEDWYYLNIEKGTYKKCSKCGEIKLIQRFDKNGSKGYMSMCKECRKKS